LATDNKHSNIHVQRKTLKGLKKKTCYKPTLGVYGSRPSSPMLIAVLGLANED
jgi:hypothetical protein